MAMRTALAETAAQACVLITQQLKVKFDLFLIKH